MSAATIQAQSSFFAVRDEITAAIDARDIAAVAFEVLTRSGHEQKIYHLTGAEVLSFSDMLEQLGRILGRDLQLVRLSPTDRAVCRCRFSLITSLLQRTDFVTKAIGSR
jgi:uncharacterized protein YbjT (DUF2867 family)